MTENVLTPSNISPPLLTNWLDSGKRQSELCSETWELIRADRWASGRVSPSWTPSPALTARGPCHPLCLSVSRLWKRDNDTCLKALVWGFNEIPCKNYPTLSSTQYKLIIFPIKKQKRWGKLSPLSSFAGNFFFLSNLSFSSPNPSHNLMREVDLSIFVSD